jgi:hypothetical protein
MQIPMAVLFKASILRRLIAGIAGLNAAENMDVRLLCVV